MNRQDVKGVPSISIAIPVYNQASTIAATIESALKATHEVPETEIVVCDNHSNDGTDTVVARYRHQVRVIRPERHLGMAANWNHAVRSCSGEWIGMLSGDDRIYPSYIHALRQAIGRDSHAVFAMGGWNNVDVSSGRRTRRRILSLPTVTRFPRVTEALIHGPKASFSSYCFLKACFDKVGGFSEEYHLIQDWILQFHFSFLGSFVKTNSIIAEYLTSQVRVELEHARVPLFTQDFATFCSSTIWEAADLGLPRSDLVRACESHIARAEQLLSRFPDWREQGDIILRPVYERIGRERVAQASISASTDAIAMAKQRIRQLAEYLIPV